MLTATVEHPGGAVVLIVAGKIDMHTAQQVHRAINHVLCERPRLLVVDLSKVGFLDSAALNVLLAAHQQAGAHTQVHFVATARTTLRLLRVTGLHELLAIYPTRADALSDQPTTPTEDTPNPDQPVERAQ